MAFFMQMPHAVLGALLLIFIVGGKVIAKDCTKSSPACRTEVPMSRDSVLLQTNSWHLSEPASPISLSTDQDGPKFFMNFHGTCESSGWLTITDVDECLTAGAAIIGYEGLGFQIDQPAGGYAFSGTTIPGGCAMHFVDLSKTDQEKKLHFYPNASGACSANMFMCFCKQLPPLAPGPTPAPTPACHTCSLGDLCFQDVAWTMVHGFRLQPEWYSSGAVDQSSCFEDVQMFLYERQQEDRSHWDGMLSNPIPSPCYPKSSAKRTRDDLLYCR